MKANELKRKLLLIILISTVFLSLTWVETDSFFGHEQLSTGSSSDRAEMTGSPLPTLLNRLLICISFHFNVEKLIYLEAILELIHRYETKFHLIIVTENAKGLRNIVQSIWGYQEIKFWEPDYDYKDGNPHALLWTHRVAIDEQVAIYGADYYSSVLYLEDDTRVDWNNLVSWALDMELLEPLGFTRCFYRTEYSERGFMMLDWIRVTSVAALKTLTFNTTDSNGFPCGQSRKGIKTRCKANSHFLSPDSPFQGMWLASNAQLKRFMASPFWKKETANLAQVEAAPGLGNLGYPERTNALKFIL